MTAKLRAIWNVICGRPTAYRLRLRKALVMNTADNNGFRWEQSTVDNSPIVHGENVVQVGDL